tara:strand:+ start:923 stop:3685 length:2763 start_codon:yes stop_codon:yes gene_type:complete
MEQEFSPGALVEGRFEIRSPLGQGGMGVVVSALDRQSGREVALKFLSRTLALDSLVRERFQREAELTARVDGGPGVVRVLKIGLHEGSPYSALELCPGGDLADALRLGLDQGRVLEVCEVLARTLARCHAQGIVHRDVKPQNVLFDAEGNAKLCDFGLAVDQAEQLRLTQSNTLLGTPSYMAPEQIDDARQAGPPADVYALGSLLYKGLAGRPPFVGSAVQVLRRVLEGPPAKPPSQAAPGLAISEDLDLLVARALASDPALRPSALEFAEDLARIRAGETPSGRRPSWLKRSLVVGAPLVALLFVGGGARWAWNTQQEIAAASRFATSLSDPEVVGLQPLAPEARARALEAVVVLTFDPGEEAREAPARERLEAALLAGTPPEAVEPPRRGSRLRSLAEALALTLGLEEEENPKLRSFRFDDAWGRIEHAERGGELEVVRAVAREVLRRQYRAQVSFALDEVDTRGAFGLAAQLLPRGRQARIAGLSADTTFGWERDLGEALDRSAERWERRLARYLPPPKGRLARVAEPRRELEILTTLLGRPTTTPLPPKLQGVWRALLERWIEVATPPDTERVAALATRLFDLCPETWRDPEGLRPLLQSYLDANPNRAGALPEGVFFSILRVLGGTIRVPAKRLVISHPPPRAGLDARYPGSRALAYWDYQIATSPAERQRCAERVVLPLAEGARPDLSPDLQARVLLAESKEAYSLSDGGARRGDLPRALSCIRLARPLPRLPATLAKVLERELELEWVAAGEALDPERASHLTRAANAAFEELLRSVQPRAFAVYRTLRGAFWDHLAYLALRGGSLETGLEFALAAAKGDPADMPVDNVDLRARSWGRVFEAWRLGERWDDATAGLAEVPAGVDRQNPICAGELALLLDALGRKEEARERLQRGLSSYPGDAFLQDVARRLGE